MTHLRYTGVGECDGPRGFAGFAFCSEKIGVVG